MQHRAMYLHTPLIVLRLGDKGQAQMYASPRHIHVGCPVSLSRPKTWVQAEAQRFAVTVTEATRRVRRTPVGSRRPSAI